MCKNQSGVTLIELLLVLALLGTALAGGWNAFSLGQKAWKEARLRWEAEAAVRLASQIITNQIGKASYMEIRNDDSWNSSNNKDRIISVNSDGEIILKDIASGNNSIIASMEGGGLELSFQRYVDNNDSSNKIPNALQFTVSAKNGTKTIYDMTSSIMMSNMLPGHTILEEGTNQIRYNSTVDRFSPSIPSAGFTCGI